MEILEDLQGGKVYLDTNVFIYAVEAVTEYRAAVETLFALIEDRAVSAVTSELRSPRPSPSRLRWAGTTLPKSMKQC
jgi:hypothetical protein